MQYLSNDTMMFTQIKRSWTVFEGLVLKKVLSQIRNKWHHGGPSQKKIPSRLPLITVLPESPSRLLFLLLLVELPVSRPTPVRHHKDGLTKLLQQMRRLRTLVDGVVVSLMWSQPFFTYSVITWSCLWIWCKCQIYYKTYPLYVTSSLHLTLWLSICHYVLSVRSTLTPACPSNTILHLCLL